jgi:hypothetical protein
MSVNLRWRTDLLKIAALFQLKIPLGPWNEERTAEEIRRQIIEAFPSTSDTDIDLHVQNALVSVKRHRVDAIRQEAKTEDEGAALLEVASGLFMKFEQYSSIDSLQESISLFRRVLALCPLGHPLHITALGNFTTALIVHFKQMGDTSMLAESIRLSREALDLCPQDHPHRGSLLSNLADALLVQQGETGNANFMTDVIRLYRKSLDLHPFGHPEHGKSLSKLAGALMKQNEGIGNMNAVAESIRLYRNALDVCQPGHPSRGSVLNNLAVALGVHFERTGDKVTLAEAILLHREALALCPHGNSSRRSSLRSLAEALLKHYQITGAMDALAEVVCLHREVLDLCPLGHPDRGYSLSSLAGALIEYYHQTNDVVALTEAIHLHREAAIIFPHGHPGYAISRANLAKALFAQYEQKKDPGALAEAIRLHRELLAFYPHGHPERGSVLNNFAIALRAHSIEAGDTKSLMETLDLHREALDLNTQGYLNRVFVLRSLSDTLLCHFNLDGDANALVDALKLYKEMLNVWPVGHPQRYDTHYRMARVLLVASPHFNWTEALDHLMEAIKDGSASPRNRLSGAIRSLRFIDEASNRDRKQYFTSQRALDFYTEAIQLLPIAAHAGLDLSTRLRELSGSEQLCLPATMRATILNQLPTAVELYEQGKAVFWSQALQLRSTTLDGLPAADQDKLKRIFFLLEKDSAGFSTEVKYRAEIEQQIEHRRVLNQQADGIIAEIRTRPGHGRFLKIPQFEELAQAAKNSIVVVLVAEGRVFFAIIIQAAKDLLGVHLPMTSAHGNVLPKLIAQLANSGMRDYSGGENDGHDETERASRIKQRQNPVPLAEMWRHIVKPVISHLGLQVGSERTLTACRQPLTTRPDRKQKEDNGHVSIGILPATFQSCRYMLPEYTRVTTRSVLRITSYPRTPHLSLP